MENPAFIWANKLFFGKLHINKQGGKGTTRHKSPITEEDLAKLKVYFQKNMAGPQMHYCFQEIVLFNIIFYMGCRGQENLHSMKTDTFALDVDPSNGLCFLFQQKDETDKNHVENDTEMSNQARIYEIPGKSKSFCQSSQYSKCLKSMILPNRKLKICVGYRFTHLPNRDFPAISMQVKQKEG